MNTVLRVQDLCKRYPGFLLDHVSFSLAPHRIMGLIGKKRGWQEYDLKSHAQYGIAGERQSYGFSTRIFTNRRRRARPGSAWYSAEWSSIR